MLPLLIQILLSLLVAAALGAGIAWWWFRRHYEDVTETYAALETKSANPPDLLTKADFETKLASNLSALPKTDLVPLEERVAGLERAISSLRFPEPDLSPLNERLQSLEAELSGRLPALDSLGAQFGPLSQGLVDLRAEVQTIPRGETGAIQERLDALTAAIRDKQWVDLRPLEARMARLEGAIQAIPAPAETDLDPIFGALAELEGAVKDSPVPEVDLGPLHSGLARLEMLFEKNAPVETDLTPLQSQLDHVLMELTGLQERVDMATRDDGADLRTDLSALSEQVGRLEAPDLSPLRDRLALIERMVGGLSDTEPDLRPILVHLERLESLQARLVSLDNAVGSLARQPMDLEPLHRQLELIKSQLMAPAQGYDILNNRLGGMSDTLASLESTLLSLRATMSSGAGVDSLERRFAGLQDAFLGLRQTDLTPVINQVRAIEHRLDLGAVEDRLTAIEYSLAAVHQMLRSRDDTGTLSSSLTSGGFRDRYVEVPRWRASEPERSVPEPIEPEPPVAAPEPVADPPVPDMMPITDDPISAERRPGDQANLLLRPAFGGPDDLERISGVGPMLRDLLHSIGV